MRLGISGVTIRRLSPGDVANALFFASIALNCALTRPGWDWKAPAAALAAWYVADFLSGAVHLYMDYRPCPPGVGLAEIYFWEGPRDSEAFLARQAEVYARIGRFERLVYDFKKHHPFPDLLGRHGPWHLMKAPTTFVALPLSLALNLAALLAPVPGWAMTGLIVLLLGMAFAQYFHGALHKTIPPSAVVALRRIGLLMTPAAHARHHASLAHDFSTISGWSNPLLNVVAAELMKRGVLSEAGLEPT